MSTFPHTLSQGLQLSPYLHGTKLRLTAQLHPDFYRYSKKKVSFTKQILSKITQAHTPDIPLVFTRIHFFYMHRVFCRRKPLFFKQRTIRFKSLERNKIFVSASTEKHSKGLCEFFTVI